MNRRTTRGVAAASAVVVAATLLAGCAEDPLPQPQAGEPFDGPVLTEDQDSDVLTAVGATLEKADKDLEAKALKARVAGPALEIRENQYKIAKANDGDAAYVTSIPSESQQLIIPTTETWRRTSFSITPRTDDMQTLRLVAMEQAGARDDYKMWAWVQLIPGVQMPAFADAGIGSEAVKADDESLAATPADALSQYADLVALGAKKSSFADGFDLPDGDLVERVQTDARNVRENTPGFEDAGSKLSLEYEARKDALRSVRTADGGALVMGVLEGESTLEAEEEAEVPPLTATQKALYGDKDLTNVLKVGYTDMVALYVPPKDSEEKIRPLGYQHDTTAASNE
jgi:hypothetical protein